MDLDNDKEKILLIDEEGNKLVLSSSEKNDLLNGLNSEGSILKSTRGMYSGTKTGYNSKRKIGTTKVAFAGYNPEYPRFDGTYVGDVYEFSFEVTVPANASFMITHISNQNKTHMGFSGYDGKRFGQIGYDCELVPSNSSSKTFKVFTIAVELTHNILGQQVTPVLYPKQAKQPNLYYFEYYWVD